MTVKKANHKKHGVHYCEFGECRGNKVPSQWHNFWGVSGRNACDKHKHFIEEEEDDGYMSEADYQTWGRL